MKSVTATVAYTGDEKIRLNLKNPLTSPYGEKITDKAWATGVLLEGVYVGRRWFVVELHSIWDRGNGKAVGTYYTAYDLTSSVDRCEILRICERLEIAPPNKIEAVDA